MVRHFIHRADVFTVPMEENQKFARFTFRASEEETWNGRQLVILDRLLLADSRCLHLLGNITRFTLIVLVLWASRDENELVIIINTVGSRRELAREDELIKIHF